MSVFSKQVKELRRYVESYEKQPFGREVEGTVRVLSEAADTIESLSAKLQAANMEQSERYYSGGWIPCSDRLPEPFENVLVSTKEGGRAIAHRCPNQAYGRYYDLHSSAIENITAWMPLPEPYHEP